MTLEPNSAETIALRGGDLWQGVYRFDAVEVNGNAVLRSEDPIRVPTVNLSGPTAAGSYTEVTTPLVAETVSVTGNVSIPGITATNLTVKTGARLTHSAMTATQARSLDLKVTGTLTIEDGGSIDVTGRGYPEESTYPGATGAVSPTDSAGSHVGTGGLAGGSAAMPTYGSVERPREAGSGGWNGAARPGGGVIRIEAGTLALGGATAKIVANGDGGSWRGGAGGSIWITAASMTGDGLIEAAGGVSYRQGGGGAVAIEYGTSAGTELTRVNAKGGSGGSAAVNGGAGTVVLKGPGSTHGTLRVDNLGTTGQQTVLPSLGFGTAQPETSGATLATGRGATIPPYSAGHWVEITRGGARWGRGGSGRSRTRR
ncbi:MAG: hypothetical protein IPP07_30280 [Holophagales bacterium]|nr:hypothetical protein [Holophagales bacterium]